MAVAPRAQASDGARFNVSDGKQSAVTLAGKVVGRQGEGACVGATATLRRCSVGVGPRRWCPRGDSSALPRSSAGCWPR